MDSELADPPVDRRRRELWLSHLFGHTVMRNVRDYALERLPSVLDATGRAAAEKGIDDAIYGFMMVVDGVVGPPRNDKHVVVLRIVAELRDYASDTLVDQVEIGPDGEGMCMGVHGWWEGDYGRDPLVREPQGAS